MNEYMDVLKRHVADNPPDYSSDAHSILEMLFSYLDIFMNAYIQRYTITIEDRGSEAAISIEMYAKQKKTELPDKPAVK